MIKGNLKRLLKRYNDGHKYIYRDGDFKIVSGAYEGAYELLFEIYLNERAIIQCLDGGELHVCNLEGEKYIHIVREVFPDCR